MQYQKDWCPRLGRYVRRRHHGHHGKPGRPGKVPNSCHRQHKAKP